MSTALQVALFLASLAIIILVAGVIPIAFMIRRDLKNVAQSAEETKSAMLTLVQHSHELIRNVTEISRRASAQMDEIEKVVATVRKWTEGADHFLKEVGSAVEPPVHSIVRNMNLLRTGVTAVLRSLRYSIHRD